MGLSLILKPSNLNLIITWKNNFDLGDMDIYGIGSTGWSFLYHLRLGMQPLTLYWCELSTHLTSLVPGGGDRDTIWGTGISMEFEAHPGNFFTISDWECSH